MPHPGRERRRYGKSRDAVGEAAGRERRALERRRSRSYPPFCQVSRSVLSIRRAEQNLAEFQPAFAQNEGDGSFSASCSRRPVNAKPAAPYRAAPGVSGRHQSRTVNSRNPKSA